MDASAGGAAFAQPALWIGAYFVTLSVASYLQFGWDKWAAVRQAWRLSEKTLLMTALPGGALGAKAGQRAFRHKTRKEPFRTQLNIATGLNLMLMAGALFPGSRALMVDILTQIVAEL